MCQKMFNRAGSALKIEIYNDVKGTYELTVTRGACMSRDDDSSCSNILLPIVECRTGEVRVTQGHGLPARFIIHTVGPVYNVKYQTAAQNTLHCCYR